LTGFGTVDAVDELDEELRSAALIFLRVLQLKTGGPVRFDDVAHFEFRGTRVPLLDRQRGIRKPRLLRSALSFRTVYAARPDQRPYDDDPGPDGYLRYKWRGDAPDHPENIALRNAMRAQVRLIWFRGIDVGLYLPVYPVWLVAEEPAHQQFVVALDLQQLSSWGPGGADVLALRRAYAERIVRDRLHQPLFRARVLSAYGNRCSLCHLGHNELLDAAHIKTDAEGGEPVVTNGIAMCKIHHAAFDGLLLGVRPDYRIEVRQDLLSEDDGPTLRYSLQGVHGNTIELPSRRAARPDRALLEERYERFLAAV
jgi:putative restriction endonuclease